MAASLRACTTDAHGMSLRMGGVGCGARLHVAQVEVVHGIAEQDVLQLAQVALLAVVRLRPVRPPHILLDPAAPLAPLPKPAGGCCLKRCQGCKMQLCSCC